MAYEAEIDEPQSLDTVDHQLAGWDDPAARLREALDKNELVLFAQPILSLREAQRFPMSEVLVRMREEEEALLPPGEFLPVFEHFGMMPELDRWVVRNVVERLAARSGIGYCINVSGQTLGDLDFAADVEAALRAEGVAAQSLVFEIDESDVLSRPGAAADFSAAVRAIGCGLSLDGFARRSVSFAPLKALRVNFVKVDGSVVRNILKSEFAHTKLKAVQRVAEVIGLQLVAECVEEPEILAQLRTLGVEYAQGFGVALPAPIDSGRSPRPRR